MKSTRIGFIALIMSIASMVYAQAPISLSGPYPSLPASVLAGDGTTTYVYTVTNTTPVAIPLTQAITGNSTSVTISKACTVVPAHGSCTVVLALNPTLSDSSANGISDVLQVNYNGRLPAQVTSNLAISVTEATLNEVVVSPGTAQTVVGASRVQYTATGRFSNGAVLDITTLATWSSSNTTYASFPVALTGTAYTYGTSSGSTIISASYKGVSSTNTPTLTVNNFAYIANYGNNTVTSCTYSSTTSFTSCTANTNTNGYFNGAVAVAINTAGTFAYVGGTNGLSVCSLSATTGLLSNCTLTVSTPDIQSIVIDSDDQYAYFIATNVYPSLGVYSCAINSADGTLNSCTLNTAANALSLAIDKNNDYVYTGSYYYNSNMVYSCTINGDQGTLSCTGQSNATTGIGSNWILSAAATNFQGSYVYLANSVGYVYECPVSNGTLSACTENTSLFSNTDNLSGMDIKTERSGSSTAFISVSSGTNANTVYACPITSSLLTTCTQVTTSVALSTPGGIAIR